MALLFGCNAVTWQKEIEHSDISNESDTALKTENSVERRTGRRVGWIPFENRRLADACPLLRKT